MRTRTGCQPCRDRHVKCVKVAGSRKCQKCTEAERECLLDSPLHFRPVKSVRLKSVDGRRVKHDLRHTPRQVWVDLPSEVRFVSLDHETDSQDLDTQPEEGPGPSPPISPLAAGAERDFRIEHNPTSVAAHDWNSPHGSALPLTPLQASLQHSSPDSHFSSHAHASIVLSPAHSAGRPASQHHSPSVLLNSAVDTSSPNYGLGTCWPFQNQQEARLLHHYIVHLSMQFDSCDKQRHFGKEIPKRAAHYPVIKNAIFAVASRQMSLLAGTHDDESPHYVSECLRILIKALEDPMGHFDENLLAAVILLRTHEEMSENDERRHLFGTTRILNSIASFAADGGLRESASWVSLRQHIYISLTSQHPLTINLTNYRHSSVFRLSDDESWANRIIFIFARILTHVFGDDNEQLSLEQWADLDSEVTSWEVSKPWHFAPLFIDSPGVSALESNRSPWPELYVCNPAQVVGLQHYYLAKVVLAIYDPRLSKLSFGSLRLRRDSESMVRECLRMVVGLAVSNDHVQTAMFQASHILSACGMYLNNRDEQEAAVGFLEQMTQRMGWQTSHIIRDLKEQWQI
ncbi:hypothetical protein CLAIMM_06846 [Cladophialophora immunda]|nr:hypothetical protein CLAIMM_06846 [Cladophialophora immunda]